MRQQLPRLSSFAVRANLRRTVTIRSATGVPGLPTRLPILLLRQGGVHSTYRVSALILTRLLHLHGAHRIAGHMTPHAALHTLERRRAGTIMLARHL